MKKTEKKVSGTCESCAYYTWDEEYEYYVCEADLDEDEMYAFLASREFACPFYRLGDEYAVVRKQM